MQKSILSLLEAKDNLFLSELHACRKSGFPTYIYGAGEGAENVKKRAAAVGFYFDGKLVDKAHYESGNEYACLEEVCMNQKINLVIAFRGYSPSKLEVFRDNIKILVDVDCFSGNYDADPEIMTYDFVKKNESKLTKIYNSLKDDRSREVLLAYINQKISMDYRYLSKVQSFIQYFDPDIIHLDEGEALVDAGAYVGDTVEIFIEQLKKNGVKSYDAIYSFEPDVENYEKLSRVKAESLKTFMIATSDHKGTISFTNVGKGSSSRISRSKNEHNRLIRMDLIDDILKGKKVTFIKMDVEGSELASLKGSRNIIQSQRPKLAVCIYHKRNDLWEIQNYINEIVDHYSFYIRAYEKTATELVLYALPN